MEHTKTGPKDVFMYLLSVLGLYVTVISLGSLIFQIIDIYFPDLLSYDYGAYASDNLKWPLSVLVVTFPVYVWLSYYIQNDVMKNPEKRELRVRKWLTYFTLSLAAVIIAGDLISLIYTYLSGEITARFILKVITVFAIAASVFIYYIWNLREKTLAIYDSKMKIFIYAVILVVLVFVVWGFYLAGSPQSARRERFDGRRINDLEIIQSNIVEYWRAKGRLPETLEELKDDISGFNPPRDPETGESYEYSQKGDLSFELCANFSVESRPLYDDGRVSRAPIYPYGYSESWEHGKGRECFIRTIDPQRYLPLQNPSQK